jgi:hypothetical protein
VGKFLQGLVDELTMHVRQLGWLHATPRPPKHAKGEPDRRNRMERLQADGREIHLPEISAAHLLSYLLEMGPTVPSGAGSAPVSHTEIGHWQDNTGIELTAWEARTLRVLSKAYLSECLAAEDPSRPAPYLPTHNVVRAANDMRAAIAAMAQM